MFSNKAELELIAAQWFLLIDFTWFYMDLVHDEPRRQQVQGAKRQGLRRLLDKIPLLDKLRLSSMFRSLNLECEASLEH